MMKKKIFRHIPILAMALNTFDDFTYGGTKWITRSRETDVLWQLS